MKEFEYHDLLSLRTRKEYYGYMETYHPLHPLARGNGYVYYHRLIMENLLGRYLKPHEIVHHKDQNPLNNRPDNLVLVQSTKEHGKHHRAEPPQRECKTCGKKFIVKKRVGRKYSRQQYCSEECSKVAQKKAAVKKAHNRSNRHLTKEELQKLIWEKPTLQLAKELGISDKAIEKWCKKYGIEKPPRGYWAKKYAGKI